MPLHLLLLACLCLLSFNTLLAADLHVSRDGNGSGDGSFRQPFASIAEALARARAEDEILLRRGDLFREGGLTVPGGIRIGTYGASDDPKPIVSGAMAVSGFRPWPGREGVYFVRVQAEEIHQVYLDGNLLRLARYPNVGWLRADAGSTAGEIRDLSLEEIAGGRKGSWVDGNVRWRRWTWWYETRPITGVPDDRHLRIGGTPSVFTKTGLKSGYYIDNVLRELDHPGEWFFNAEQGVLYVFPPDGTEPENLIVEAIIRDRAFTLNGGTLENTAIRHFAGEGIGINAPSFVRNCEVHSMSRNGIHLSWNANGSEIRDSTFRDILNVAISTNCSPFGGEDTHIENNRFADIGMVPGYGGSGSWHAAGVVIFNASHVRFRLNRLYRTGYAGIILGSDGHTVERNVFHSCMSTLNDGGAVYTNSNGNIIRENIILHTLGDLDSSQRWVPLGHGIWPEFLSEFRDHVIVGNTVYGSGGYGIFLPNNFEAEVAENTLLSNRVAGLHLEGREADPQTGELDQRHRIEDNLIGIGARPYFPAHPENLGANTKRYAHLRYEAKSEKPFDFGTMTGTTFLHPAPDTSIVAAGRTAMTTAEWQSSVPDWADPDPRVVEGEAYLFINDTTSPADMVLPEKVDWTSLEGDTVAGTISVAPFRSRVLLTNGGDTTDLPPYFLRSEQETVPGFSAWMARWPVAAGNWAMRADPDADGLPNLLERAAGRSPAEPSPPLLHHSSLRKGEFLLHLGIVAEPRLLQFETSADLRTWQEHPLPEKDPFPLPSGHAFGRVGAKVEAD